MQIKEIEQGMQTNNIVEIGQENIFKKNPKGDIVIAGSGSFFRKQKEHYSTFPEPCKKLYNDQICEVLKDSPSEIRSLLSLSI